MNHRARIANNDLQTLFEFSPEPAILADIKQARILDANPATERLLGYLPTGLRGRRVSELCTPSDSLKAERWLLSSVSYNSVLEALELMHASGATLPVDLIASHIPWHGSQAILVTVRDARERREALKERDRLAAIVEQTLESIMITDPAGTIEYVNRSFETLTGYTKAEVVGNTPRILKSGVHEAAFYDQMWATLSRGEVWQGKLTNRRKDGALFIEEGTITPIRNPEGEIINFVAMKRDITHEMRLEAQLRQSQRLEAVGTLAGGIAHDFNNILGALMGFTEMAQEEVGESAPASRYLKEVHKSAGRAVRLVDQILTFSRRHEQNRSSMRIQSILREAMKLLGESMPSSIEMCSQIDPACGKVHADPTQIHQLIMHLCTNACHAMRETGGVLTIALAETSVGEKVANLMPEVEPGRYARLSVQDTGPGIDLAIQERIFEPYFTTKSLEEGAGLGLATVHGIVKAHGGGIVVESQPGAGALFAVYLPLHEARKECEPPESEAPARGAAAQGRILFVDDEEQLVTLYQVMLEKLGYKVRACNDSLEAFELFQANPQSFDLLISDQTMPSMTGLELTEKIRKIAPYLPVIICSGYSEALTQEELVRRGIQDFLAKPVSMRNFAAAIQRALAQRRQ